MAYLEKYIYLHKDSLVGWQNTGFTFVIALSLIKQPSENVMYIFQLLQQTKCLHKHVGVVICTDIWYLLIQIKPFHRKSVLLSNTERSCF